MYKDNMVLPGETISCLYDTFFDYEFDLEKKLAAEKFVHDLKSSFDFKENFNLLKQLQKSCHLYLSLQNLFKKKDRKSVSRKKICEIINNGEKLLRSVQKLDQSTYLYLDNCTKSDPSSFMSQLEWFLRKSVNTKINIPDDLGGKKPNSALDRLVLDLKNVFETGTGKNASTYYSSYSEGGYDGEFYFFCKSCIAKIDPEIEAQSIGSFIQRTINTENDPTIPNIEQCKANHERKDSTACI